MDRSSRNRLTERNLHQFTGETLFDRIARAVCRAGCLPRKELYEAWEVARRVRRRFRNGRVVDLACGHGLVAHILLLLDNSSPSALAVDRHIPENAAILSASLEDTWPRLSGRVQFAETDLRGVQLYRDDIVVSVHACGGLTDLILEQAISAGARVSVLPCCHDLDLADLGDCKAGLTDHWLWTLSGCHVCAPMATRSTPNLFRLKSHRKTACCWRNPVVLITMPA